MAATREPICTTLDCRRVALYHCDKCSNGDPFCEECMLAHGYVCTAPARPKPAGERSLYESLGGVYNIALVVDHFSDNILKNPKVGKSANLTTFLALWSNEKSPERLPGLKFQRTLWLCAQAGGPQIYVPSTPDRRGVCPMSLEAAHFGLHIGDAEFNEVASILGASLDHFGIKDPHKAAVLNVFAAHMREVTLGAKHGDKTDVKTVPLQERKAVCAHAGHP